MIDTAQIHRVLVVKLRYHGDVLLTSPVFGVLKNKIPSAQIDALIYDETRPMLENHPAISNILTISRAWKKNKILQLQKEWELLQILKNRKYDLIIHLTEHWRMAWTVRLLKPKYSIAPFIPFRHNHWYHRFWKKSFNHLYYLHPYPRHTVEKNLDALRVLGFKITDKDKKLSFVVPHEAKNRVLNILKNLNIVEYIHIHPTSRMFYKCWSPEKWAVVLKNLQQNNHKIIVTCAPDEKEKAYVDKMLSFLDNQKNIFLLNGVLNLKEMGALIQNAKLFLGVDSAPMHMAASLGTPLIVLFGSTGDLEWGAWAQENSKRILTANAQEFPCRPCGVAGCADSGIADCLQAILPCDVLGAITDLIGENQ